MDFTAKDLDFNNIPEYVPSEYHNKHFLKDSCPADFSGQFDLELDEDTARRINNSLCIVHPVMIEWTESTLTTTTLFFKDGEMKCSIEIPFTDKPLAGKMLFLKHESDKNGFLRLTGYEIRD